MNRVSYWYDEGMFADYELGLKRAIRRWEEKYKYIYDGLIQRQPETRFAEHQRKWAKNHQWDKMIVIFHGKTFKQMCNAENRLIKYLYAREKKRLASGDQSCLVVNDDDEAKRPKRANFTNGWWVYVCLQESYGKGGR